MPSNPAAYDSRWKEFRLTALLKGLHDYAQETCPGDDLEYEGHKPAKDRAIALRRMLSTSRLVRLTRMPRRLTRSSGM